MGTLSTFLIPAFWGGIGACVFLTKRISDKLFDMAYEQTCVRGDGTRIFLGAMLAVFFCSIPPAAADASLQIYVIDVGQGDSTLVVGPGRNDKPATLLIDAGDNRPGKNGAALVERILKKAGVTHLDHVVLSHYDADHMGGFVTIGTPSKSLLWTRDDSSEEPLCRPTRLFPTTSIVDIGPPIGASQSRTEWQACVHRIAAAHPTVQHIQIDQPEQLGSRFDLGGGASAQIVSGRGYVLGKSARIENANSPNEMSISVLVATSDGFDFLVTGDLIGVPDTHGDEDAKLEDALADALSEHVDLEILRIGHHGAANATSPTFVYKLKPEVALISVGAESQQGANFHHPRCQTLTTLTRIGLLIQTGAGNHDCPASPPTTPVIANGTIRIDVRGDRYTIATVPGTSSLRAPTNPFAVTCTLASGCGN